MLDLLVEWVFKLIVGFFTTMFEPFYMFLTRTIPRFSTYVDNILSFLTTAITYVPRILDLLFIPRSVFQIWFSYVVIKITIILAIKTVKFIVKIYNALKP